MMPEDFAQKFSNAAGLRNVLVKHIQTNIDIKEYLGSQKDLLSDSLFKMVGSFKTEEGDFSERDDW